MLLSALCPLPVAVRTLRDFPLGGLVSVSQAAVVAVGRYLLTWTSLEGVLPRGTSVLQWKEPSLLSCVVSVLPVLLLLLAFHMGCGSQPCLVQLFRAAGLHWCWLWWGLGPAEASGCSSIVLCKGEPSFEGSLRQQQDRPVLLSSRDPAPLHAS